MDHYIQEAALPNQKLTLTLEATHLKMSKRINRKPGPCWTCRKALAGPDCLSQHMKALCFLSRHLLTVLHVAEGKFRSSVVSHLAWTFLRLILLSPLNACCELNSHKLNFFQHSSSLVKTHHFPSGDKFASRIGEGTSSLPVYSA